MAVLPGYQTTDVQARVIAYTDAGGAPSVVSAAVRPTEPGSAFAFLLLRGAAGFLGALGFGSADFARGDMDVHCSTLAA